MFKMNIYSFHKTIHFACRLSPLSDAKVAKPHLNKKRSSGNPFGAVYRNSAALGIAQVNLALLSFARAFFLRWRVNSSKNLFLFIGLAENCIRQRR